ncbi:MAG: POTRA domain-containing protein [Terriglobia bacterium]
MKKGRLRSVWKHGIAAELALLMLLVYASGAYAQQLASGNYYEGQTVVGVDVVASPTVDLGPLEPLVKQKANQNYSMAKIRATIAAFMATKKFTKVDVEVRPEAGGLRVTFILQPAYYIGMITFPGAIDKFDYSRLLQVVNHPAEQPYEERRARQGVPGLQRFFASDGYFLASARMEVKFDPIHRLANVAYPVTLNKRARIGNIEITGPPPAEAARIKRSLRSIHARLTGGDLKPGKPFYPSRIQAAARVIQDYLGNHGWLASHVEVGKPQYNPRDNRARLDFRVALGPKVQIRVTGARIRGKTLKQLVPVYEEKSFDQDLVEEGERNIVAYLQSKGYFDAKVNPQIKTTPSEISVAYAVDRGRRHTVISVRIEGSHHFEEDDLMSQVLIQKAHFFSRGKFSQDLLNQSVTNLENVYHDAGFEDVKVEPKVVDLEPKIEVAFQIVEGPETIVNALAIDGVKTQSLATLAPHGLRLRVGKPYSPSAVAHDRSRLIASYLNRGYLNAGFQATVRPVAKGSHRVDVTYLIDEGVAARIGRVEILGEQHTRKAFIQRNISVKPLAPLSEGKMLETESALYDLGIFDWASVDPARPVAGQTPDAVNVNPPMTSGTVEDDVLVKVHEAKRNTISYGAGFQLTPRSGSLSTGIIALPGLPIVQLPESFRVIEKDYVSPLGSVEYSRRNLRGRGETAAVSTLLSRLDQRAAFTYSIPEFGGLDWSSLFNVSAERTTQNPLFTARFGQAAVQFERPLNAAKTEHLQFRYSFTRTSLTNLLILGFVPPQDQSIQSSTVSAAFIRDTRDKPLDAHRGVYETLNFGVTPTALGSSDSYARFFGQAAWYHQVWPWMVLAESFRLGLEGAFAGSHIPISERFFSGGADSLRGFPINGAGPQGTATLCTALDDPASCTAEIRVPVGGPQLVILNSEDRFPLPIIKNLGGVVFYDGGNVYDHVGFSRFFSQYSNTVGFGLRYETPVGPIRVDVGRNLSPIRGIRPTQIFVTIGQSF